MTNCRFGNWTAPHPLLKQKNMKTRCRPRTRMLTRMLMVQVWKHMDMQSRRTLFCNSLLEQACTYFPYYQSAVWSGKCRVWSVEFCKTSHRHGHTGIARTVANGCERLRTVADGCERLRTVATTKHVSMYVSLAPGGMLRFRVPLCSAGTTG